MRISKVTCTGGNRRRNKSFVIFTFLLIAGLITGTAVICKSDDMQSYCRLLFTNNMFKYIKDNSFGMEFIRSLVPVLLLLVLQLFSGYFAFGQVISAFTVVYRGIVSAVSAALVYITFGIKGIFAVLITVVPFAAVTAVILIFGARESVKLSGQVAEFSFFKNNQADAPDTRLYLIKFAVLAVIAVIAVILDTIIAYFFKGLFF